MTHESSPEQVVADRIGVPRGMISSERRPGGAFVEGLHWVREAPSGRVVFTGEGVAAVRAFFKLPPSPAMEKETPPDSIALTIHRHTANPRIVVALTAKGAQVRLRIKGGTQKLYAPQKRVQAVAVGDPTEGLYEIDARARH